MKTVLTVNGMSCPKCSARVEKALAGIEGVKAKVDLEKKSVTIEHPEYVSVEKLRETISANGYDPV